MRRDAASSSAEMMRRFCVLAFCAANYKRGLYKAQISFRTFARLHICARVEEMMRRFCVLAFCAANYKIGLCKAQIRFRTFARLHICARVLLLIFNGMRRDITLLCLRRSPRIFVSAHRSHS
jgi:hypothetical protein